MLRAQEAGLVLVIIALVVVISSFAGNYVDRSTGHSVNTFLNPRSLLQVTSDASLFAIMAVGATIVIISGGIDLAPGAVIALSGVVAGGLFVDGHWSLAASAGAGFAAAIACGAISAALVVGVRLPPFIATLGVMGIARGVAFIVTEGRYFDVSGALPAGWRFIGLPLDWTSPILMVALALVFQILMTRFQWGRAVFAIGGNQTAAMFSGVSVGVVQASVYLIAAALAGLSGIALTVVQGQGKADLAMGYELDIIASAVVGGASLSGGRGSVVGAVLGALIFGVLRNALPQIPGATFYDRLIVGLVVIVIVVMDQVLQRRKRFEM